ncbi:unnamed protein product [Alopecurus aequalis]
MGMGIAGVVVLLLVTAFTGVTADTNSDDVTALNTLYTTLDSPSQLTSWVSQNGDPCGHFWLRITCANSRVITIKIPGMGLRGTLGYNMNILTALIELDTSNNNLGGSDIPYNLPPNLETLNLEQNNFTGTLPYSISKMAALKDLKLGYNQISDVNIVFNQLTNLTTLDLSYNTFSGTLPESFTSLKTLTTLYLQNNRFTGTIGVLSDLPLTDLNVANNQFSGWIPDKLKSIGNLQTSGNSFSNSASPSPPPTSQTTPPPQPSWTGSPSTSNSNNGPSTNSDNSPSSGSSGGNVGGNYGGKRKVGGGAVAGIVISLLVLGAMVAFFFVKRKSMRRQHGGDPEKDVPLTPLASGKFKLLRPMNIVSPAGKEGLQRTVSMNLKPPSKIDLRRSSDENDRLNKSVATKTTNLSSIRATVYTVADLQVATWSFNADSFIGEGAFGRVYRGQLSDQKVLAVKKINLSAFPSNPSDFFIELVANISKLNHPNLWSARALEYLHETCFPSVIHKNFKSANILLDDELNPHLSDCGFSDLIPNHELQESDDNSGYRAPEVTMSG